MGTIRSVRRAAALAAAVSLSCVALAKDYSWDNGLRRSKSGYWTDPAMWDGVSYPQTTDDNVFIQTWQAPTLKITNDTEIGTIKGFNYCAATIDLGGCTLAINPTKDYGIVGPPSKAKGDNPGYLPTFKNGTLTMKGDYKFTIGQGGQDYSGGFTLDNCTANLKLTSNWCYNPPRITVKNGGVWNYPGWSFYQYNQKSASMCGGFIRATGADSQINMMKLDKNASFEINFLDGGLIAADGAKIECSGNVAVSGSHQVGENQWFSTNSYVEVDNATLIVSNKFLLGGYYSYGYTEHYAHYGPQLIVKGPKAKISIGDALAVFDEVAAKFDFTAESAGWKTAPVTAKELVVRPRNADYVRLGTTTNFVRAANWAAKSGASVPLIALETANAADLAALAEHSVIVDYDATLFPAPPTVNVSADGKQLLLTAPAGAQEALLVPELTASCEMIALGTERVTLAFTSFGRHILSLDAAKVTVYDNAACTGTPVAENALDVATMTNAVGTYATDLTGLDLSEPLWAKVCVTNACGSETNLVVKIDEDMLAPPQYTVKRETAGLDSERVTLAFTTFGCVISQIAEAKVYLYDNPACTGEPVQVKTLDAESMTDPKGTYAVLFEDLDSRTVYGVKVVVENTAGSQTEKTADFSTPGSAGEKFYWNAVAGVFEKAANWTNTVGAVTSYPTTNDTIDIDVDGAVVTLNSDETIAHIASLGHAATDHAPIIDLGGHVLYQTAANSDYTQIAHESFATEENLNVILPALTYRNGTLNCPRGGYSPTFQFHSGATPGTGSLIFDNCTYERGKLFKDICNGFRLFVQNGSRVVLDGHPNGIYDFCWDTTAGYSGYGFICVKGAGSYFATTYDNSGSSRFTVNGNHNGFYVMDGAAATITMSTCIGGTGSSTNNFVQVDNATLTNKYNLAFGFDNNWGNWVERKTVACPQLRILGANARVVVGTELRILNGIGAEIRYTIPTDGFAATPLTAKTLTVCEPTLGQSVGPARLVVNAREWKKAHPLETQTLLTLETANKDDLQSLVGNAKIHGHGCTLAVTADGKSVTVTAPERTDGLLIIVR